MSMDGLLRRLRHTGVRRVKHIIGSVVGVSYSTLLLLGVPGVRINTSSSIPIGLYSRHPPAKSYLLNFAPLNPMPRLQRHVHTEVAETVAMAPLLLKPIVAHAGDTVDVSAAGIPVNGMLLNNTAPKPLDTQGRSMPVWPFGRYQVPANSVWVASTYNARSFDSRYFGPISTQLIREHLRPLLTGWR